MNKYLAAALISCASSTAVAQDTPDFSGAYVGLSFGSATPSLTRNNVTAELEFKGPALTAGYLLPVGAYLVGGELSIEDSTATATVGGQTSPEDGDVRTTLLGLKVGRAFGDWMPFGVISFGVAADGDGEDADVRSLKIGTEYAITNNWFATGAVSLVDYTFEENGEEFCFDGTGVSVGVVYRF